MNTSTHIGRPRSFDRTLALDTALRLFWQNGYTETSMRDLSQALGIGTPSLYNAFGDKQALFTEVVRVYDREYGGFIEQALKEEPTATKAITRILSLAPSQYTRPGLPRGCLISHGDAGSTDPVICRTIRKVRHQKIQILADKIRTDMNSQRLPSSSNAEGLARYVMAVLAGMTQLARDGATRSELEAVAQIALSTWPQAAF